MLRRIGNALAVKTTVSSGGDIHMYSCSYSLNLLPRTRSVKLYCAACKSLSSFVLLDSGVEWICTGNAAVRKEGCGMRLRVLDLM
jgi:hypothetical protein